MSSSARPTGSALLERDGELARVAAALGQARDRGGSLVVVEGPARMGKKAVLRGLEQSQTLVACACWGDGAGAGARGRRRPATLRAGARECVVRRARRFAEGCGGFAAQALGLPGAPRGTLEESASRADGRPGASRPVLAVRKPGLRPSAAHRVDDAHRADAPSLRYLRSCFHGSSSPGGARRGHPPPRTGRRSGVARSDHRSWTSPTSWIRVVRCGWSIRWCALDLRGLRRDRCSGASLRSPAARGRCQARTRE
jgi:hypothetical protein